MFYRVDACSLRAAANDSATYLSRMPVFSKAEAPSGDAPPWCEGPILRDHLWGGDSAMSDELMHTEWSSTVSFSNSLS